MKTGNRIFFDAEGAGGGQPAAQPAPPPPPTAPQQGGVKFGMDEIGHLYELDRQVLTGQFCFPICKAVWDQIILPAILYLGQISF